MNWKKRFWMWVMLFAYRRCVVVTDVPDGVPTLRSMEFPCPAYAPRKPVPEDWRDCQSDGHYLCKECCHRRAVPEIQWPDPVECKDQIIADVTPLYILENRGMKRG